MMNEEHFRINCKCGIFIDSKVIKEEELMIHMKHMFGGEKVNIFKLKLNGEVQGMDYHTAFDEEWILDEVKNIMRKSNPDDVIEIINVSKNEGD